MINLLDIDIDIQFALRSHLNFIDYYIKKKIGVFTDKFENDLKNYERLSTFNNPNIADLISFLTTINSENKTFYERVIVGNPQELLDLNQEFKDFVDNLFWSNTYEIYQSLNDNQKKKLTEVHIFFSSLKKIFKYDELTNLEPSDIYSAYKLTENLGVRTCVYCNRVYSLTHNTNEKKKLLRPQLDHWFPKSKYPLLAVSFFNLVPSCYHCNSSVKGDKEMDLTIHIHPYVKPDEFDDFLFSYNYQKDINKYEVTIVQKNSSSKHKDTLEFLKIDEMYDSHQDELDDLIKIKKKYSTGYLSKLKSAFPGANLQDKEIYRLAFGTELDKKDFHNRPFSKFKHDILTELGIIKMNAKK